ncbi:DUF1643 domain-containing protein [Polaribacter sp.]|uniref:DUF1643 domain-containing protein n=1 Tax=Polaribacter sp. TaxID=1920175 RepID=UPI00404862A4
MDSKSLREHFGVTGFFYQEGENNFRKFLDIKKKSSTRKSPDLMVIMMNPGSSHPVAVKKNEKIPIHLLDKLVPTYPDNTQDQIMKVMIKCNFEYARILNLSDLCDSKSSSFYKKMNELNTDQINHSIFQAEREYDFKDLFESNAKLIVAWGVHKALKDLAISALSKIGENKIGLRKENIDWAFYHPLPRINQKQLDWINEIEKQINITK